MPQKYKLTFRPESTSIEVLENTTLMEALKEAGIFLDAPCGGRGTCGKCLVKISENGSDWTCLLYQSDAADEGLGLDLVGLGIIK